MLQQILNEMHIEAELLAELDEEQKQMLFCKMRQEQVRRWNVCEISLQKHQSSSKVQKEGGKKVSFLTGGDGEPIVVVLGDDADEVETMLEEKAKRQTELEVDDMRKAAEEELDKLVKLSRSTVQAMEKSANRQQQSRKLDPTREAVVKSLQEATLEMEKELKALEIQGQLYGSVQKLQTCTKPSSTTEHDIVTAVYTSEKPKESVLNEDINTPICSSGPQISVTPYNINQMLKIKKLESPLITVNHPPNSVANSTLSPIHESPVDIDVPIQSHSLSQCLHHSTLISFPLTTSIPTPLRSSLVTVRTMTNGGLVDFPMNDELHQTCPLPVAAHIEQFERLSDSSIEALKTATLERAKKRRQKEILDHLRQQVDAARRNASDKDEVAWREQERKAKEAEKRIREIARRAREAHRRTSNYGSPQNEIGSLYGTQRNPEGFQGNAPFSPAIGQSEDINGNVEENFLNNGRIGPNVDESCPKLVGNGSSFGKSGNRPTKPPSRESIVSWFKEEELPRGAGLDKTKQVIAPWFHGIISRCQAERLLENAEIGAFLVRVSERIWGYAVSYRARDRCRHYLVDIANGKYSFLGSYDSPHQTLGELVDFHAREPITSAGGELLTNPCSQTCLVKPDYLELFHGTSLATL